MTAKFLPMQFYAPIEPAALKKERSKARELKKTNWWRTKLQAGVCYYCEEHVGAEALTMDHKVPLARGGKSSKSNIVACCKQCNTDKGTMTAVDEVLSRVSSLRSVPSDL